MSWEVRKHQGAVKQVVAGFAAESEAKADAMARCIDRMAEYVVFDAKSNEVGRAIFDKDKAYWQEAP